MQPQGFKFTKAESALQNEFDFVVDGCLESKRGISTKGDGLTKEIKLRWWIVRLQLAIGDEVSRVIQRQSKLEHTI